MQIRREFGEPMLAPHLHWRSAGRRTPGSPTRCSPEEDTPMGSSRVPRDASDGSLRAYRQTLAGLHALDRETERDLALSLERRRPPRGSEDHRSLPPVRRIHRSRIPPLGRSPRGHRPARQPRVAQGGGAIRPAKRMPTRHVRRLLDSRRDPRVRRSRLPRRPPRDDERRASRGSAPIAARRTPIPRRSPKPRACPRNACASFCRSWPRAR